MTRTHQQEVDENYAEFEKLLPSLMAEHANKFALMKNGKVLGIYTSFEDAAQAASGFITDELYSVQQITNGMINLGFFNYAVPVH